MQHIQTEDLSGVGKGWFYRTQHRQLVLSDDGLWIVGERIPGSEPEQWRRIVTRQAQVGQGGFFVPNDDQMPTPQDIAKALEALRTVLFTGLVEKYKLAAKLSINFY